MAPRQRQREERWDKREGMLTRYRAGIVSAPLWDSQKSTFAGLLTSTDYINVIQYYCQFPDEIDQVDQFRLSSLRGRWPPMALVLGNVDAWRG